MLLELRTSIKNLKMFNKIEGLLFITELTNCILNILLRLHQLYY